jgi:ATP-dependent DNA helicase PIF1
MAHKGSKSVFANLYPKLNAEQKKSLQLIEQKKSVCNTGPGGSGKTWFTNEVIRHLPKKSTVAVTATTALAAKALPEGTTLHRFLGIGVRNPEERKAIQDMHKRTKVLIIDEISMLSAEFMDEASKILQKSTRKWLPFGGIQLICVGDFLQLPPVSKFGEPRQKFAYHSKAWKDAKIQTIEFTEIKRQAGDDTFKEMLNEIRFGFVSAKTDQALRSRVNAKLDLPEGIKPSSLFATRNAVAELNMQELEKLPGRSTSFYAQDSSPDKAFEKSNRFPYVRERADKQLRCPRELKLREGAQVVLLRNKYIEDGLVNGSRGVVIGFRMPDGQDDNEEKKTKQTGHKKSDYTEEEMELLQLTGFQFLEEEDERTQDSHVMFEAMKKEEKKLAPASTELLPIVRFDNGVVKIIGRADFDFEEGGQTVLIRKQLPLDLAWGLTIHACQGMTLTAVKVSFQNMFEYGQVYVALSRCPRLDCVTIAHYDRSKIKADPDAVQFYRGLSKGGLPIDEKAQAQKKMFIESMAKQSSSNNSSSSSSRMEQETKSVSGSKRKRDEDDEDDEESEGDGDDDGPMQVVNMNGVWVSVPANDGVKRRKLEAAK